MKKNLVLVLLCFLTKFSFAQTAKEDITKACLNYIEGFYEGDKSKLSLSLKPSLYKFGYWKDKNSGKYRPDGDMNYRQAIDYVKGVLEKKHFPKAGAPKKVEVLNIQNAIAAAKVTAWWGVDYILLSKQEDKMESVGSSTHISVPSVLSRPRYITSLTTPHQRKAR